MAGFMTETEQDQMDECAKRVAGVRFNMVVLKTGLIDWLRQLQDATDQEDINNRAGQFIKQLQKGINRDTGRVQRSRK